MPASPISSRRQWHESGVLPGVGLLAAAESRRQALAAAVISMKPEAISEIGGAAFEKHASFIYVEIYISQIS